MATGLLAKGPVNTPKWVFFLRIAIVLFSVLVLALSAWSIHLHNNYFTTAGTSVAGVGSSGSSGASSICAQFGISCKLKRQSISSLIGAATAGSTSYAAAPALMIFAAIFSLLTEVTVFGFLKFMPTQFFRICVFIAYCLVAIFLLSGWAYLASVAAIYGPSAENMRKAMGSAADKTWTVQMASAAASAAALGAVLWVLVCINTVMFALACFRTEGESMTSGATELHQVQKSEASVHVGPAGGPGVYYNSPTPQPQAQPYGVPQQPYGQPAYGQQGYVVPQATQ